LNPLPDIWAACQAQASPANLSGSLMRIVESQTQIATTRLVDDLAEQALLETLLEEAKPPLDRNVRGLSYLLATPFRYPPLRHGSRFGTRLEPSLLYGSHREETVLAEAAYYRCLFFEGMAAPPPSGRLLTQHTIFGVRYRTRLGLRLQRPPFSSYRDQISSASRYEASQRLGAGMRAAGVEAFEYVSARDPDGGSNVALFTPSALAERKPGFQQTWLCETRPGKVQFSGPNPGQAREFRRSLFLVDGALPEPAV
jgi:hypothetical protein